VYPLMILGLLRGNLIRVLFLVKMIKGHDYGLLRLL
jgi:hypothetical protein